MHKSLEAKEQVQMHVCLPHVLWGGYLTPKGIIDDGVGIFTSGVGGTSEMHVVLIWHMKADC